MIFTQFFRYITSITSMGVLKVVRNWKFEQGADLLNFFDFLETRVKPRRNKVKKTIFHMDPDRECFFAQKKLNV